MENTSFNQAFKAICSSANLLLCALFNNDPFVIFNIQIKESLHGEIL